MNIKNILTNIKIKKIFKKSILLKLLVPFLFLLTISSVIGASLIINYLNEKPIEQEVSNLRSIAVQLDSIWENLESNQKHIMRQSDINLYNAGNISMYNALETVKTFSEKMETEGIEVKVVSQQPLNAKNVADFWEKKMIENFEENDSSEGFEILEEEGNTTLRYAMPVRLEEGCISCHTDKEKGEVHGVFSLETPLDGLISETKTISMGVYIAGLLIIILVGLFMWFITKKIISRPLDEINGQLVDMNSGEGDLTYRIRTNSEDLIGKIGLQFNHFLEYLGKTFLQVNSSTKELEKNTKDISASVGETRELLSKNSEQIIDLSKISTTMAETLSEIKKGSEEVATSSSDISKLTQECFEETDSVVKEAEKSGESMEMVVSSVMDVNKKVSELEVVFELLNQSIEKIVGFVTNINDISEQTNLLALNAAIEAARAGESGQGFAVVADEVRKLAEHSSISAREISEIISELGDKTKQANNFVKESGEAVVKSKNQVERAQEMIKSIINRIEQVSDNMQGITAASQEQTALSEEMTNSVTEASKFGLKTAEMTEHFASSIQEQLASMEEIENAITELEKTAEKTMEMINKFKV